MAHIFNTKAVFYYYDADPDRAFLTGWYVLEAGESTATVTDVDHPPLQPLDGYTEPFSDDYILLVTAETTPLQLETLVRRAEGSYPPPASHLFILAEDQMSTFEYDRRAFSDIQILIEYDPATRVTGVTRSELDIPDLPFEVSFVTLEVTYMNRDGTSSSHTFVDTSSGGFRYRVDGQDFTSEEFATAFSDGFDNPPVFEVDEYVFALNENLTQTTEIGTVTAHDPNDDGSNVTLSYALIDAPSYITIDSTTGQVFYQSDGTGLDFEEFMSLGNDSFSFNVEVTSTQIVAGGVDVVETARAKVNVKIADVFEDITIDVSYDDTAVPTGHIDENAADGVAVTGVTIRAADPDLTFGFGEFDPNANHIIVWDKDLDVQSDTFGVSLDVSGHEAGITIEKSGAGVIDYEERSQYNLELRITNGDSGALSTADIAIQVANLHDEGPTFSSLEEISIVEGIVLSHTFTAEPEFEGLPVSFRLVSHDGEDGAFAVDSATGILSYTGIVDGRFDLALFSQNVYNVTVEASDGSFTSEQILEITVLPGNQAPVLTDEIAVSVNEGEMVDITPDLIDVDSDFYVVDHEGGIFTVELTGAPTSGVVEYDDGDGSGFRTLTAGTILTFDVNAAQQPQIRYSHDDSEVPSDTIILTYHDPVPDKDGAPLSVVQTISVAVSPVNDQAPILAATVAQGEVAENITTEVDTNIRLSVTDADRQHVSTDFNFLITGDNSSAFSVVLDETLPPDNNGFYFKLVKHDGASLNFEASPSGSFTLSITAQDGTEGALSSAPIDVTIQTSDVNDAPVLTVVSASAVVPEEDEARIVTDASFSYDDEDVGDTAPASFTVTENGVVSTLFEVAQNDVTGFYHIVKKSDVYLDYERQPNQQHLLEVTATDASGAVSVPINLTINIEDVTEAFILEEGSIIVNRGESTVTLTDEHLHVVPRDEVNANAPITYSIVSVGDVPLYLNDVLLTAGDSFTQEDIGNGLVTLQIADPSVTIADTSILLTYGSGNNVFTAEFVIEGRHAVGGDDVAIDDTLTVDETSVGEASPHYVVSLGDGDDTLTLQNDGDDWVEGGRGRDVIHLGGASGSPAAEDGTDSLYYNVTDKGGVWQAYDGADVVTGFDLGTDKIILRGEGASLGSAAATLAALDEAGGAISLKFTSQSGGFVITGLVIDFALGGFSADGARTGNSLDISFKEPVGLVEFFTIAGTVSSDGTSVTDYNLYPGTLRFVDITKLAGLFGDEGLTYQNKVIDHSQTTGTAYGRDISDVVIVGENVTQVNALSSDDEIHANDDATTLYQGGAGADRLHYEDLPATPFNVGDLRDNGVYSSIETVQLSVTGGHLILGAGDHHIDARQATAPVTVDVDGRALSTDENEIIGGAGDDTLTGNQSVDTISGGAGDDVIHDGTVTFRVKDSLGDNQYFTVENGELVLADGVDASVALNHEDAATRTVTVVATDDANASLTDEQSITINVTDVADVNPVITSASTTTVDENDASFAHALAATPDVDGGTVTFTVKDGLGDNQYFTVVNGVLQLTSTADPEEVFDEDAGTRTVTVVATDDANASLTAEQTITITIIDVADGAPVITSASTATVDENDASFAHALTADADLGGTVTFTVKDSSGDNAYFTVANGELVLADGVDASVAFDHETSPTRSVTVVATDDADNSLSTEQTITISITDIADVNPAITSAETVTVNENNAGFAHALTADADLGGTVTFNVKDSAGDNAYFTVDNGQLVLADGVDASVVLNHEDAATRSVTVVATDDADNSLSSEQAITINVTDVADVNPAITSANTVTVNENDASFAHALTATTDVDGGAVTFSVKDGLGDNQYFTVVNGELVLAGGVDAAVALNHEDSATRTVTVVATDDANASLTEEQTITITITDVADVNPLITSASTITVNEDEPNFTHLLEATTDLGGTATFTVKDSSGDNAYFTVVNGELVLASGVDETEVFDYDTTTSRTVTVVATDDDNISLTSEQIITINITDVSSVPPTIISPNTASVNENDASFAHDLEATTDLGGTATFSVKDGLGDNAYFTVVNGQLVLASGADATVVFDHETTTTRSVIVVAADDADTSLTAEQTITINITDINDVVPNLTLDNDTFSLPETTFTIDRPIFTADEVTFDGQDDVAVAYSFNLADDFGGTFAVDTLTGAVSVVDTVDFENGPTSYDLSLVVTTLDIAGNSVDASAAFTVNITDVESSIRFALFRDYDSVLPGEAAQFTYRRPDIRLFEVNEEDIVYSMVEFEPATRAELSAEESVFEIDPQTGDVTFKDTHEVDYYQRSDYFFKIIATANGVSAELNVDMNVPTPVLPNPININGTEGDDILVANGGHDILRGLGGNDILIADRGMEQFYGGDGRDLVSYENSYERVIVDLSIRQGSQNQTSLGEEAGGYAIGDTLISVEGIRGSAFDDILTGSEGRNVLEGGGGNDTLTGKGGYDTFVLGGLDDGVDTVTDFARGDMIRLDVEDPAALATAEIGEILTAANVFLTDVDGDVHIIHMGADNTAGTADDVLSMILENYMSEHFDPTFVDLV